MGRGGRGGDGARRTGRGLGRGREGGRVPRHTSTSSNNYDDGDDDNVNNKS